MDPAFFLHESHPRHNGWGWGWTATARVAPVSRPPAVHHGRHRAAWVGLVPRPDSRGGTERVGWDVDTRESVCADAADHIVGPSKAVVLMRSTRA